MQFVSPSKGAIVFLHGSGDTGVGFESWINLNKSVLLHFQALGFATSFPTAPFVPYTLNDGMKSNVWFDRTELSINSPEDLVGVQKSMETIDAIIDGFIEQGIESKNIFVFGMSMGGHMALQVLNRSRYANTLGGIVALSCYVSNNSSYWTELKNKLESNFHFPPLLMCHGDRDALVLYDWGVVTSRRLKEMGIRVQFHSIPGLYHDISYKELELIKQWVDGIYHSNKVAAPSSVSVSPISPPSAVMMNT